MPFPAIPALVLWSVGTVAALGVARLARREYQRVNDELDALRARRTDNDGMARERAEGGKRPTLKRDPVTGRYRPE